MSAAGPPQGANSAPWGAAPRRKPQAWGDHIRRTPLVAAGFLAGAVIGALPPIQDEAMRWRCSASGGQWRAAVQACEYAAPKPLRVRSSGAPEQPELLLNDKDGVNDKDGI